MFKPAATLLAFAAVLGGLLVGWCSADAYSSESASGRLGTTVVVARLGVRS